MSNDNLIESIKSAIADGKHEEARILLRVALKEPTAEVYYLASQVSLNEQQRQSFLDKAISLDSHYASLLESKKELDSYDSQELKLVSLDQEKRIETLSRIKVNWLVIITLNILGLLGGIADVLFFNYFAIWGLGLFLIILFFFYAKNFKRVHKTQVWLDSMSLSISYAIIHYMLTDGGGVSIFRLFTMPQSVFSFICWVFPISMGLTFRWFAKRKDKKIGNN